MSEKLQTIIVFFVIMAAVAWSIKQIFFSKKKSCCGSVIGEKKNATTNKCKQCEICKECEMKMDKSKNTNQSTHK